MVVWQQPRGAGSSVETSSGGSIRCVAPTARRTCEYATCIRRAPSEARSPTKRWPGGGHIAARSGTHLSSGSKCTNPCTNQIHRAPIGVEFVDVSFAAMKKRGIKPPAITSSTSEHPKCGEWRTMEAAVRGASVWFRACRCRASGRRSRLRYHRCRGAILPIAENQFTDPRTWVCATLDCIKPTPTLAFWVLTVGGLACCSPNSTDSTGLPDYSGVGPREGKDLGGAIVAEEAAREMSIVRETHYRHAIRVDESMGVFDLDCSGFTDYVLARAAPSHFRELVAATRARPLAEDYVTFFGDGAAGSTAKSWEPLVHVAELAPGDFVAWLAAPDTGNTGHVVIVREKPTPRNASSFLIPIWDSTHTPHGPQDARTAGTTGLGQATIVLVIDTATGAPKAHEWYDGSTLISERIAMGRAR